MISNLRMVWQCDRNRRAPHSSPRSVGLRPPASGGRRRLTTHVLFPTPFCRPHD